MGVRVKGGAWSVSSTSEHEQEWGLTDRALQVLRVNAVKS